MISCQESTGVELRLENTSTRDFDRISVNNVSFGPLKIGEVSEYLTFETIYQKEYVEVVIGDQVLKLIPEDFDDKDFYATGSFKYQVDIIHQKWLDLKFVEE